MAEMTTNYNRLLAMVLGWVLVLVGLLGFVPGITTNGVPPFTGVQSGTEGPHKILGIFQVNILHNIVHLLLGAVLLAGAYVAGGANARMYNIIVGAIYLVTFLAGIAVPAIAELVAIDTADHGLHLVLGIVLLAVPFLVKETPPVTRGQMMR